MGEEQPAEIVQDSTRSHLNNTINEKNLTMASSKTEEGDEIVVSGKSEDKKEKRTSRACLACRARKSQCKL